MVVFLFFKSWMSQKYRPNFW